MLDQGPEDIFDISILFENMPASRSFMTLAASLKLKKRNANAAFSVLVCFGFEPPNKLNFSHVRCKASRDTHDYIIIKNPKTFQWTLLGHFP